MSLNAVTTPTPSRLVDVADDLLLRITPPRVPRHQVARPRLRSDHERLGGFPLILVQAPAGYGKTSLLAQWRREHLAQGRVVAWLSVQPSDDEMVKLEKNWGVTEQQPAVLHDVFWALLNAKEFMFNH